MGEGFGKIPEKLYYKDENGDFQELTAEIGKEMLGITEDTSMEEFFGSLIEEFEKKLETVKKPLFDIVDGYSDVKNGYTIELIESDVLEKPVYFIQVWVRDYQKNNGYVTVKESDNLNEAYLQFSLMVASFKAHKAKKLVDIFSKEEIEITFMEEDI